MSIQQSPVRLIVHEFLAAHSQLETANAHVEREPKPLQPGPKIEALAAATQRYATAFQALQKLADPEEAYKQTPPEVRALDFNEVGHVDRTTNRVALTIADASIREDYDSRAFFTYSRSRATASLEPWTQVEDIVQDTMSDAYGRPVAYHLTFTGAQDAADLAPETPIYMQRYASERDAL